MRLVPWIRAGCCVKKALGARDAFELGDTWRALGAKDGGWVPCKKAPGARDASWVTLKKALGARDASWVPRKKSPGCQGCELGDIKSAWYQGSELGAV